MEFAPDLDPTTPGILLESKNMYPSLKGFRSYPSLVAYSSNALPSKALGGFSGVLGVTDIVFIGVSGQIYRLVNQTLESQGLTLQGTAGPWRFTVYGDKLIAVDGTNAPLQFTIAGGWANLGGNPPVAAIAAATDHSLFLIPPNSRTWWSSLSGTDWTPSIANQVVTAPLDSTPGNIVGAHALRGGIVLYKQFSLYYGTFIGPPFFWDFQKISAELGAPSHEAVANLGDIHYFLGIDDFYSFDGYSLRRIPNNLKEWFFSTVDGTRRHKVATRWDLERSLVFWHFPSKTASPPGSLDSWICLNVRTGKWTGQTQATVIDFPIFTPIETGAMTYLKFSQIYQTYASIPTGFLYGDIQSQMQLISGAVTSADQKLHLYNGTSTGSVTTHDFGDRYNMYRVTRVRPEFALRPVAATLTPLSQYDPGTTPTAGSAVNLSSDGWFNLRNTARLQRFKIEATSEMEIVGVEAVIDYAGRR